MTGNSDNLAEELRSAAILIGGRARRLDGRFKPWLPVGGQPIVMRQLDALARAGVEQTALVGRWPVDERPPRPVVADAVENAGPLSALYTALLIAPADRTVVLAGDMPLVTATLVDALFTMAPDEDAVVPRTPDGLHPLCGCYRRSAALRLKARLDAGKWSVREALQDLRVREIVPDELAALDPDGTMLMNVNTPADYERASATGRQSV
jgi:molybdopterin-guanine dinucleotide biosynthesis protein A